MSKNHTTNGASFTTGFVLPKRFCRDCKYGAKHIFVKNSRYCIRDKFVGNYHQDTIANLYGNCKYYKRKWWKFWVK